MNPLEGMNPMKWTTSDNEPRETYYFKHFKKKTFHHQNSKFYKDQIKYFSSSIPKGK